jgi:hypothetical protein
MNFPSVLSKTILFLSIAFIPMISCKKDEEPAPEPTPAAPKLIFKLAVDPNQVRLNNLGQPATLPSGHAAQNPQFNKISAHYLELSPGATTLLGGGNVLYNGATTTTGGAEAIDFSQSTLVTPGQVFKEYTLSGVTPGTYEYVRLSLSYQNYDISYSTAGVDLTGTIASFLGFNTYISSYQIKNTTQAVNANKLQGYWGFETNLFGENYVQTGQAPEGATTVPNPLFATSPIPQGSCIVTAAFGSPLVITGNETSDIVVTLSLSGNNSFEWIDDGDGKFEPVDGEAVVDMGVRGLVPIVN